MRPDCYDTVHKAQAVKLCKQYVGVTRLWCIGHPLPGQEDKLKEHLEEIDKSAQEMYEHLMKQFKEQLGITEKLKAENQMLWVHMMNEIHQMTEEIILEELIYN